MNVQAKIGLCNFVSTVCMLRISSGPEVVIGDPTHGVDDCDVIYDRLPNLIMITNSKTGTNAGTYCSLWGVTIQNLFAPSTTMCGCTARYGAAVCVTQQC